MKKGDFYAVNCNRGVADAINHHFLVYVGNDVFFDTIDGNVYTMPEDEADGATQSVNILGDKILDFVQSLPTEVFEVVEANAKIKTPIEIHLFPKIERK